MGRGKHRILFDIPAMACAILALCTACVTTSSAHEMAVEYLNIGNLYLEQGKWEDAGRLFDKALSYDPELVSATYNIVRAFIEGKKFERAIEFVDRLLVLEPDNAQYLSLKAYGLYRMGNFKEALSTYERVAQLNIFDPVSNRNYAILLVAAGRNDEAATILAELLLARPEDELVIYQLGLLALEKKEYKEAEGFVARYVVKKPADLEARVKLAAIYETLERYKDAMDQWSAITVADKKNASAWFELARLRLTVAGDAAGGIEALKAALEAKFADKVKAKALLESDKLVQADDVRKLLTEAKLVD